MGPTTSERIISAASKLFYGEGILRVSMDAVAEKAGVTKRTLYYHFKSKDDLVAAYLQGRDQPNLPCCRSGLPARREDWRKKFVACLLSWLSPRDIRSGRVADFFERPLN